MAEAKQLGPWPAGMNNVAPDFALPTSKYGRVVAVRNAVNADVDKTGWFRRRKGYTRIVGGANLRGGYSCPIGVFFVQGSRLYRLNEDDSTTVLFDGVTGVELAYEYFDETVFFSDGLITKRITIDGVKEWGQDTPSAPSCYAIAGALPVGTYMAAVTTIDGDGRESGASDVTAITLNVPGGIRISGFPIGKTARVYLSTCNGTALYRVAELSTTQYDVILTGYDTGKPLDTQFLSRPPAGRIIRHYKGRIYIADGAVVWFTEPYAPDLVHRGRGFFQFSAPVTVMEPGETGMWFVAGTTDFYAGNGPEDFVPTTRLNYGAVYGTSRLLPRTKDAIWYSEKGVVMATKDGQIENLQEANVAAGTGVAGASLIREQDGTRQVIVSVQRPEVSPLAASSFIEMEIVRKATS